MALGNIERGRKKFADCATTYSQGDRRAARRRRQEHLGHVLLSRHLRGALQAVEQGRGRHAQGARDAARTAACAELSRLFLDRPGHQSRRRHEDDQARRRSASRRRLYRRLARLGFLPHRQLRRRGEEPRARDRSQARGSDHQRPSRRRLLARRPHAGSQVPVGPCPRPEAGGGRIAEDRGQDRQRPARGHLFRRLPPTRKKKTARAADRRLWGLFGHAGVD